MSNIIVATFVDGCTTAVTEAIYEGDYGMILQFAGLDLPDVYTVNFGNEAVSPLAHSMIGNADGVEIPNQLLTESGHIMAWVFLHTGEDDGETEYAVTIPVLEKMDTQIVDPTPEQESALNQAIAALNAGVERAETAADSAEQIAADLGDFETAMEAVTEAKNAAQQSASNASTSEGNAAQSAQNAAQSASGAASSAEGAYASEKAAAQSAEDASSSASAAAASEAAARAVAQSIPADYSALSANVDNLQTALFDDKALVFEIGSIVSGNPSSSTRYCRTVDFIPVRNGAKLKINNQAAFALSVMSVYYYSEADTSSYISANTIPSVPVGQSAEVALTQTGYFKLRVAQPDAATDMTSADVAALNQSFTVAEFYLADEVAELQEDVDDLSEGYTDLSNDVSDLKNQINGYSAAITPVFKDNYNFRSDGVAFVYDSNYETYYIPIESGIKYTVVIGTNNTSEKKGFRFVYSAAIPANNVSGTFLEEVYSQNVASISYQYTANASGFLTVAYWQGLVLSIEATGEIDGIKDQLSSLTQTVDGYGARISTVEQDVEQLDAFLNGVPFNYTESTTLEYAIPVNTDCILDVLSCTGSVSVYTAGYTSDVYATITAVGKYYFTTLHDGNLRFYVAANSSISGKLYLKTRFDVDASESDAAIPLLNAIEIKTIKAFDSFDTIEGSYSFDGTATIENYRNYATTSTYAHNTPPVTIRDQSGTLIYNNLRLYENVDDTSIAFWAFNKYGYYLRYVSMSALAQRNTTFLDDEYYVILNQYYGYPKAYWVVSDINVEWLNLESKMYTVGGNSADFATFTAMLTALANDTREKTVYVNPGEYDIFTEMGGADYIASVSPQASTLNWRDVCHVVPPNTTIIGIGNVVLKWLPTAEQMIDSDTAFLFSPLNISGTCTIKNIKVQAQNCRYVVHDETSGIADYNGSKHTYIDCVFTLLPGAYGSYVYGAGHNKLMEVTFDRCIFDSQNSVGIWSTHDVYAAVNERSRFSLMNCVFVSNKTDPYIAFSSSDQNGRKDEVIICNCHIPKIRMITGGSAAKQGYDVTLIGCNTVPIEYSDLVTDRYTINQYNSIS